MFLVVPYGIHALITSQMFSACVHQLHCKKFEPHPAMFSRCFWQFPGPLAPSVIAMCLPHGFIVTDPIAPSQLVPLLVFMFVLCWKPNRVCVQCVFSIYSLSLPWGFSSLESRSFPQGCFPLCFPLFPSLYAYASLCRFSLPFIALYLLGVFLSGSLTQLYMDPSIGELFSISGPQGK